MGICNSFRMSQYALLGSSLTPARVPIYSSSFVAPSSNTVAPRFGAEGTSTRYSPTYNGSYSRYQLQIDEPVVPNGDLIFPRHSKKNAVAYSGWMEKHSGIGNTDAPVVRAGGWSAQLFLRPLRSSV